MNRTKFIDISIKSLVGLSLSPIHLWANQNSYDSQIKKSVIKEFVVAGHNHLDKVKEMVTDLPNLLYSRYDWGNGDFEEAIEGAGHVGNKEIANYLIEKGARVNIFVLTMLGKTNIVKSILNEYPNLLFTKGPHGFSLLHHAIVGGEEAKELHEYFLEKGLMKNKFSI